ncbi:MAG: hypothetical protein M0C28_24760 [Candidatus Moduliflexus flocculans]|nr:hypothetical protein [Candidatus Moduliflexus flocculans]
MPHPIPERRPASSRWAITTGARPTSRCRTRCFTNTERDHEDGRHRRRASSTCSTATTSPSTKPSRWKRKWPLTPEMLGKVFENLIEENRRKGLGLVLHAARNRPLHVSGKPHQLPGHRA